jgi:SAM-dependent methyltransferase
VEKKERKQYYRIMAKLKDAFIGPSMTRIIRFLLDECIPPVLRDRRWFYLPVLKIFNKKMDIDFRKKAYRMTEEEYQHAYEKICPLRKTDMTPRRLDFVLSHLTGRNILEVGCGNGDVSIACAQKGYEIVATDLAEENLELVKEKASARGLNISTQKANVEKLPFSDKQFDVIICLHTLEHVRDLFGTIQEIKRVASKRIIIIVPRERYYRYACNYHLNFFGGPEQLMLAMKIANAKCEVIEDTLCYIGDLD